MSARSSGFRYLIVSALAVVLVTVSAEAAVQGVLTKRRVNEFDGVAGKNNGNRYLAWTQSPAAHFTRTKVMARRNGNTFRVSPRRGRAYAGGISGDTLIYQQVRGDSSNLMGFNLRTKKRFAFAAANTRRWEMKGTISGRWIMFGRDLAKRETVILLNRKTGNTRKLADVRTRRGRRAARAGQVNGNWAVYYKCNQRQCEVIRYNIKTNNRTRIPNARPFQYAPSVARDGDVYFAASGRACGANVRLMRRRNGRTTSIAYIGNKDTLGTYVAPAPGAKVDVLFDKFRCGADGGAAKRARANVYKVRVR